MRKNAKFKQILESATETNAKAATLEKVLNAAINKVVEDVFADLERKNLLVDAKAARNVVDIILGQVTMPDYPDL